MVDIKIECDCTLLFYKNNEVLLRNLMLKHKDQLISISIFLV